MILFPTLSTDRLILRKMDIDDVPALLKYANHKAVADNIINMPYPMREPDAVFRIGNVMRGFKSGSKYVFSLVLKERSELIGEIALHITRPNQDGEIAYWVGEPFWNNGYTTEAIGRILDFGFEQLSLHTIMASCYLDNIASQRVLIKNGFSSFNTTGRILQLKKTNPSANLDS